jgi:hypothetical protein
MSQRPKAAPHVLTIASLCDISVTTAGPSFISVPEWCRRALPLFGEQAVVIRTVHFYECIRTVH